jgi:hypothetical protein
MIATLRIKKTLLIFILATFTPDLTVAAAIRGAGAASCGTWLNDRANNAHNPSLAWIMGFMSSYNHFHDLEGSGSGVFAGIDHNSIAFWMDNFCRSSPLSSVYKGTLTLIEEVSK